MNISSRTDPTQGSFAVNARQGDQETPPIPPTDQQPPSQSFTSSMPMQPPATPSIGNANYTELLSTISELQLDLQRTVSLAQKLKAENAGVRKNYEEIKTSLVRTRQRYGDTRSALLEQIETSTAKEAQIENAIAKWRQQLDSRTR